MDSGLLAVDEDSLEPGLTLLGLLPACLAGQFCGREAEPATALGSFPCVVVVRGLGEGRVVFLESCEAPGAHADSIGQVLAPACGTAPGVAGGLADSHPLV